METTTEIIKIPSQILPTKLMVDAPEANAVKTRNNSGANKAITRLNEYLMETASTVAYTIHQMVKRHRVIGSPCQLPEITGSIMKFPTMKA
jgi:hypothetical protein